MSYRRDDLRLFSVVVILACLSVFLFVWLFVFFFCFVIVDFRCNRSHDRALQSIGINPLKLAFIIILPRGNLPFHFFSPPNPQPLIISLPDYHYSRYFYLVLFDSRHQTRQIYFSVLCFCHVGSCSLEIKKAKTLNKFKKLYKPHLIACQSGNICSV